MSYFGPDRNAAIAGASMNLPHSLFMPPVPPPQHYYNNQIPNVPRPSSFASNLINSQASQDPNQQPSQPLTQQNLTMSQPTQPFSQSELSQDIYDEEFQSQPDGGYSQDSNYHGEGVNQWRIWARASNVIDNYIHY